MLRGITSNLAGLIFFGVLRNGARRRWCFTAYHQMARYADAVSPLTDLAVVYGTDGFQMGFGFATIAMPQVKASTREEIGLECRTVSSLGNVQD